MKHAIEGHRTVRPGAISDRPEDLIVQEVAVRDMASGIRTYLADNFEMGVLTKVEDNGLPVINLALTLGKTGLFIDFTPEGAQRLAAALFDAAAMVEVTGAAEVSARLAGLGKQK